MPTCKRQEGGNALPLRDPFKNSDAAQIVPLPNSYLVYSVTNPYWPFAVVVTEMPPKSTVP